MAIDELADQKIPRFNELPGEPGIQTFAAPTLSRRARIGFDLVLHSKMELPRKEVIQPQVPLRLPCYDFTPVTIHSFGGSLPKVGSPTSGANDSHGVTGGVYKTRERIHGVIADTPLLAIPTSSSRVADYYPNWDRLYEICLTSRFRCPLYLPL